MPPYKPGDKCATCNLTRCACTICRSCGLRVPRKNTCDKCHICASHHDGYYPKDFPHRRCDYVPNTANMVAGLAPTSYIINPLHRTIGVEIEFGTFASIAHNHSNQWIIWDMHRDGSVSGSGQELVTGRMRGDQYIFGMSHLVRGLISGASQVNETCGYHVHVDAAELSPMDLRRVMVAFQLIQPSLYGTLVSAKRATGSWGKLYCPKLSNDIAMLMSMEDKNSFINWLHQWLYQVALPDKQDYIGADSLYKETLRNIDAQLKEYKGTKYMNRARRWALNLHSWMMRGTLEFRLKEGTLDPGDLIMWPLWCAWFVDKFSKASDKDIHYFLKKGLSVASATEFMCDGPLSMPNYVANWVKSK